MVYKFFDKNSTGSSIANTPNQLVNELHKPMIRKFQKRKVYSGLKIICEVLI